MKKWSNIIIHCSDSEWGSALVIDDWHKQRGWAEIGYHYVIMNGKPFSVHEYVALFDGVVEPGRKIDMDVWAESNEVGAHALGYNSDSIGVCLIGKKDFSEAQFVSLGFLVKFLMNQYPDVKTILGHNMTKSGKEQGKTCPNFDVHAWAERFMIFDGQSPV